MRGMPKKIEGIFAINWVDERCRQHSLHIAEATENMLVYSEFDDLI
jgi:hypothetical protein